MFRRNADSIQGTCNTSIERLLDFVELNFDLAFDAGDITLYFIDLALAASSCSVTAFLPFFQQFDQP
jgi:hypothetical protein